MTGATPPRLSSAGPLDPLHGFPLWFADGSDLRLELVLEPDPLAPAVGDRPQPQLPLRFPDNFPDEAFYFFAESRIPVAATGQPGGEARVLFCLEAAFGGSGNPAAGQQIVFSRIRVRMKDVNPLGRYTVVHPYGRLDNLEADERGRVDYTEDLGIAEGDPTRVLISGQVAPFLRPLIEPSNGYISDGVTAVRIQPGPHREQGTAVDYVKIIGPQIRDGTASVGSSAALQNPDEALSSLFTLQGRLAQRAGVRLRCATYARLDNGRFLLTIQAESLPGMDLRYSSPFSHVSLVESKGLYSAIVESDQLPPSAQLLNATDLPVTSIPIRFEPLLEVFDGVYDRQQDELRFKIRSSDPDQPVAIPSLAISDLNEFSGSTPIESEAFVSIIIPAPSQLPAELIFEVVVDPQMDPCRWRFPIAVQGSVDGNQPVEAIIKPLAAALAGEPLLLDGSGSRGAASFQWSSVDPNAAVTLATPDQMTCDFTASQPGSYDIQLQVTGPAGGSDAQRSDAQQITINVVPPAPEELSVQLCEYRTAKRQYLIRGRLETDRASTVIRASLMGQEIATITTAPGEWEIRQTLASDSQALRPNDVGRRLRIKSRDAEAMPLLIIRN